MAKRGLMEQDLSKLDVTTLHWLSPELISTIKIDKREEDCAFGASRRRIVLLMHVLVAGGGGLSLCGVVVRQVQLVTWHTGSRRW
jgi:hypothetical protein